MSHDSGVCVSSFVIGGLAGAAIAILYAPRKGSETRQLVADKANQAGQYAGEMREKLMSGELKDKLVTRGREMLGEVKDKGAELVNRGAEYASQLAEGASRSVSTPSSTGSPRNSNRWSTSEGQG